MDSLAGTKALVGSKHKGASEWWVTWNSQVTHSRLPMGNGYSWWVICGNPDHMSSDPDDPQVDFVGVFKLLLLFLFISYSFSWIVPDWSPRSSGYSPHLFLSPIILFSMAGHIYSSIDRFTPLSSPHYRVGVWGVLCSFSCFMNSQLTCSLARVCCLGTFQY